MDFMSYIRVSDTTGRKGRDSYGSPDEQRRDNAATAQRFGLTIGEELVHEDVSGDNVQERLAPVLALIREGKLGGIIVRYFDRFSRDDVLDSLLMVRAIQQAGGEVYASNYAGPVQPDDWQTFADAKASKAYRDRVGADWKASRRRAVERGAFVARTPPGYDRDNGKLVPNEFVPVIRHIYSEKLAGESYAALARYARSMGLDEITVGGIRSILRNRVYIGDSDSGESPAIIDAETFARVQAMTHKRKPTGKGAQALAQGLAKCSNCGSTLIVTQTSTAPIYYCRGQKAGGCDKRGNISVPRLDKWINDLFKAKAREANPVARAWSDEDAVIETGKLRDEKRFVLEQVKASTSLVASVGIEAFEKMVADAQAAYEIAEAAHTEAQSVADSFGGLASMLEQWDELALETQRRFLPYVIDRLEIGTGRVPVEQKCLVIFRDGMVLGAPDDAGARLGIV